MKNKTLLKLLVTIFIIININFLKKFVQKYLKSIHIKKYKILV